MMNSLVLFLNDVKLVARTQAFFGIRFIRVGKSRSNNNKKEENGFETNGKEHQHSYKNGKGGSHEHDHYQNKNKAYDIKSVPYINDEQCFYAVENKFVYWFFLFITHMGNEIFYITFLPTLLWFYVESVMLKTIFSWAVCMYVGQATKDLIK